ncbi:uncharacterized protein [Bombus fervidus]|uniref:uncharacterized protein n=1 Tax=Bombus fervidus TaxID=203811 RepID=UPI003AB7C500
MASIIRIKYSIPVTNNEENTQLEEADKEILININCPLKLILNYIRDIVGLDDTTEFDLCDEINCQLRKVSIFEPYISGFDVFEVNLTYLIVTFERDINGQMINITPLLTGKAARRCTDILLKSHALLKKNLSTKSSLKKGSITHKMA